jgi:hypothetical protein
MPSINIVVNNLYCLKVLAWTNEKQVYSIGYS